MLMRTSGRGPDKELSSEAFHNFYERLVMDHLMTLEADRCDDAEYMANVACVALNHLPPRYIRSDVDLTLYMSPKECQEIELKVSRAVKDAIIFVTERQRYLQNAE